MQIFQIIGLALTAAVLAVLLRRYSPELALLVALCGSGILFLFVSVNVSAGQNVKKGDVLVVLEAMKMENEIMAPRDAVVASVQVNKGDSVDSGTPLVSLQ